MSRVLCVLGAAAALVAALAVGPSPAGTADLAVRGGLPCNSKNEGQTDCPGTCKATFTEVDPGKDKLCAQYATPKECDVAGCTETVTSIQCSDECTK